MVKMLVALAMLSVAGCVPVARVELDRHRARIAVAECFLFSTFTELPTNSTAAEERVAPVKKPPCLSAERGAAFSAPVSSRFRRRFFGRIKSRRAGHQRKGKRNEKQDTLQRPDQ